jgi:hypothetical protein
MSLRNSTQATLRAGALAALLAAAALTVVPVLPAADAGLPGLAPPYTCQFTDFNPIPPGNVPPTAGCPVLLHPGDPITFQSHDTETGPAGGSGTCAYIGVGAPTCWNHLKIQHYPPGSATPVTDINTCVRANFAGPIAAADDKPVIAGLGAAGVTLIAGPLGTLYVWTFSFPYNPSTIPGFPESNCLAGAGTATEFQKEAGGAPVLPATGGGGGVPSPTGGVCGPQIIVIRLLHCNEEHPDYPIGPIPHHPDCYGIWAMIQEPQQHYIVLCESPGELYICVGTITWGSPSHSAGTFSELCIGKSYQCYGIWNGNGDIDSTKSPKYTYNRQAANVGQFELMDCVT